MKVSFTLNDEPVEVNIDPDEKLVDVIRNHLGLTGTL